MRVFERFSKAAAVGYSLNRVVRGGGSGGSQVRRGGRRRAGGGAGGREEGCRCVAPSKSRARCQEAPFSHTQGRKNPENKDRKEMRDLTAGTRKKASLPGDQRRGPHMVPRGRPVRGASFPVLQPSFSPHSRPPTPAAPPPTARSSRSLLASPPMGRGVGWGRLRDVTVWAETLS